MTIEADMNTDEVPIQKSCGKLLSVKEQCEFLSISRSKLFEFAKDNPGFPGAFPHPLASGRQVRSQAELQAWVDAEYFKVRQEN